MTTPSETARFITEFLPAVQSAGRYAMAIRGQLSTRAAKSGDDWTSVVTDADLGVQHALEAFTLSEFPGWTLWGEEHEASFNTRYFDPAADFQVSLDPINGTRLYRDGSDGFDIIVTLTHRRRVLATISWMPARGIGFIAERDVGLQTVDPSGKRRSLTLDNTSMTLSAYAADAWIHQLPDDIDIRDVSRDYAPDDPACCFNSVFTGEIGGFLVGATPLLDVGATAFAVMTAGGNATKPDGSVLHAFDDFDPARSEPLLVCSNPKLHAMVSESIRAASL